MTEQIGKVCLDLTKYPGEDFYCDGVVEDEILDIVRNYIVVEYQRIIEERMSWPILYHLSPLRENIVEYLPIGKKDKVVDPHCSIDFDVNLIQDLLIFIFIFCCFN